ncbi:MAG: GTPase [Planctomycetota bacterium]|nr:GTPase [Planctomycetota bacterium]
MKLLTSPGLAGVAVLHVEPEERAAVLACLRGPTGRPCALRPGGAPSRARLQIDGRDVDDVLLLERSVGALELHTHGAPAVLDQLDARFGVTVAAARGAADQLLRDAMSTAQFDVATEQRTLDFDAELRALARLPALARQAARAAALDRSRVAMALARPQRLALVGRQNAGKSTLFNHLLFRERALTGDTPGLTRDPITEVTTLGGYPYELVDTAGEGEAASSLDAAAIERGRASRAGALVVGVVDGARGPDPGDAELLGGCALVVRSKRDLPLAGWPAWCRLDASFSAREQPPQEVREALGALLAAARDLPVPGATGGFAALDDAQLDALKRVDVDGPKASP